MTLHPFASTTVPAGLLLALTLSSVIAPATAAGPVGSPGPTVYRQSTSAITLSLRYVHAEVTDTTTQSGKTTKSRMSSDCSMTPTSIVGRFRLRATNYNGLASVDRQYVTTLSWAPGAESSRTWLRSAGTGNVWTRADSDDAALNFVILCPTLMVISSQKAQPLPIASPQHFVNLGAETLRGHGTWHLRAQMKRGSTVDTMDVFVGRQSHFWVRVVSVQRWANLSTRSVVDYSKFNVPVTIGLPGR